MPFRCGAASGWLAEKPHIARDDGLRPLLAESPAALTVTLFRSDARLEPLPFSTLCALDSRKKDDTDLTLRIEGVWAIVYGASKLLEQRVSDLTLTLQTAKRKSAM